jgi:hypothetical protein
MGLDYQMEDLVYDFQYILFIVIINHYQISRKIKIQKLKEEEKNLIKNKVNIEKEWPPLVAIHFINLNIGKWFGFNLQKSI